MGMLKGQKEYRKFLQGDRLSRKQAILAQCYVCNGEEDSAEDCKGKSCPLYQYHPYRGKKRKDGLKVAVLRHIDIKKTAVATLIITISLFSFISGCQELRPAWAGTIKDVDIQAIITIESNGKPNAYNEKSGAIGLMQITPIVLKEYNQLEVHAVKGFQKGQILKDELYIDWINREIGSWYINERIPQMLKAYNIPDTIKNRLIAYNWGIGNLEKWYFQKNSKIKLPIETMNYIKKYDKLIEKR